MRGIASASFGILTHPYWILGEILTVSFVMAVYVVPGRGIGERYLIGSNTNSRSVFGVEFLDSMNEGSTMHRDDVWNSRRCLWFRAVESGQWMVEGIVYN